MRVLTARGLLAAILILIASGIAAQEPSDSGEPLEIELLERVDIQYVLIDAVVFDAKKRTVADLELEDFELLIDHRPVTIETLDVDCAAGPMPDPPVDADNRGAAPRPEGAVPRRFIFVLDYYHRGASTVEILERIDEAVERLHVPGDEYMLLSLGQVIRVEVPLTRDPGAIRAALGGMRDDRGLYFGFYERLTERRWFRRVLALLDLLETIPGHKSVVLFSGPFLNDGWNYDEVYDEIAAMAARSRTAFYPVDTRGLVIDSILGPPRLGRLAVETGGRATAGTNDLGRGFARAQRDSDCRYTLGFHDTQPREDRERRVRVFVRRSGHQVAHPTKYVIRSERARGKAQVRAAMMVPSMFEGDGLDATLVLERPRGASRWQTSAAVEIAPELLRGPESSDGWRLRGGLRTPHGTAFRNLEFEQPLPADFDPSRPVRIRIPLRPRPGDYTLDAVLYHEETSRPISVRRDVIVPPIPRNELFLVGPLMGREATAVLADDDRRDPGPWDSVDPLIESDAATGDALVSVTSVCWVGREEPDTALQRIHRRLGASSGHTLERQATVALDLSGEGNVRCHSLLDRWSTDALEAGDYHVTAFTEDDDAVDAGGSRVFSLIEGR